MRVSLRGAIVVAAASLLTVALSSCTVEQGSHVSRSAVYASLDEMLLDTTDVITGTVVETTVIDGGMEGNTTLSSIRVEQVYTPAGVGERIQRLGFEPATIGSGSTIIVRQPGASNDMEVAAPFLEPGVEYLLFLNPASTSGPAASHFTVVGISAGMYVLDDSVYLAITESEFWERHEHDEEVPDQLPRTLDPTALAEVNSP